jgi:phosphate starvation-inducible protein PhoH and related proteins
LKRAFALPSITETIDFQSDPFFLNLFGPEDVFLRHFEKISAVEIQIQQDFLLITGHPFDALAVKETLLWLHAHLNKTGEFLDHMDWSVIYRHFQEKHHALKAASLPPSTAKWITEVTVDKNKKVKTRTPMQSQYVQNILDHDMVFGIGPAGTGKTYLAVAVGVSLLMRGEISKLILSRPAISAGENLGFLPGDLKEKIDPYLRPLYDALHDFLPTSCVQNALAEKKIEIAPLAYMRGRTLSHSFIIMDEAQNMTSLQMKMFLTRLGFSSKMVIAGDLTQIDLPKGISSGLQHAKEMLKNISEIRFTYFSQQDVCRHPLVSKILTAYDRVR